MTLHGHTVLGQTIPDLRTEKLEVNALICPGASILYILYVLLWFI